jgi:hypothetical protein
VVTATDFGATAGARGATTSDGTAICVPTRWPREGDTLFDIAQRFDRPVQQFLHMNPSVQGLGEDIYIKKTSTSTR